MTLATSATLATITFALPLALAGCSAPPPMRLATPTFDPIAFFTGPTEGVARLKIQLSRARTVRVHGIGTVMPDGSLALVQRVEQPGKPERRRRWVLAAAGPGRYRGTLSDAAGPVDATVTGNLLHLRFRMAHGLAAQQWLFLEADGRRARNHLTVRKFGMLVATLDETIMRGS